MLSNQNVDPEDNFFLFRMDNTSPILVVLKLTYRIIKTLILYHIYFILFIFSFYFYLFTNLGKTIK